MKMGIIWHYSTSIAETIVPSIEESFEMFGAYRISLIYKIVKDLWFDRSKVKRHIAYHY